MFTLKSISIGIASLSLLLITACSSNQPSKKLLDQTNDHAGRSWRLSAQSDTVTQAIDTLWVQAPIDLSSSDIVLRMRSSSDTTIYGAVELLSSQAPEYLFRTYIDQSGSWELQISNDDVESITFRFPVSIENRYSSSVIRKTSRVDSLTWLAGILSPTTHQYGIHPVEIALFQRGTNATFRPAEVNEIIIQPWMEMRSGKGHGSPYNKPATGNSDIMPGHYSGQVSYTMPGSWDFRLLVKPSKSQTDTISTIVNVAKKGKQ